MPPEYVHGNFGTKKINLAFNLENRHLIRFHHLRLPLHYLKNHLIRVYYYDLFKHRNIRYYFFLQRV